MNIEEANLKLNQALAELKRGDLAGAEKVLQESGAYAAPLRDRNYLLALIYQARGDIPAALKYAAAELSAFPNHSGAAEMKVSLGDLFSRLVQEIGTAIAEKRWDRGLELSTALIGAADQSNRLHHLRGVCLGKLGRYYEALAAFQSELAGNPRNVEAQSELGRLQRALTARPTLRIPPRTDAWK
jgi:tetratricopeptide (TPR) repeat protein